MKIYAETDEFILRDIIESDAKGIFELDSDPLVQKYIGNKPLTHLDQAKKIIDHIHKQYDKNGIGRWAVIDKKSNEFTGWSGLKLETLLTNGYDLYYDLGFRFKPKFWGRGLATKTAMISLKYGFEDLKIDEIFGAAHADNIGSNKALQKSGLKFINDFIYDGAPHKWYGLKSIEY